MGRLGGGGGGVGGLMWEASWGEGSRLIHWAQSSGSRENNSYERSGLSIQAPSSWAVEEDQGQIMVRCGGRSGKLTLWLRSRGAGDRDGQGVDGEGPDNEKGENSLGELMECREEEQITMAPDLKF